jgi:hypothetical protein
MRRLFIRCLSIAVVVLVGAGGALVAGAAQAAPAAPAAARLAAAVTVTGSVTIDPPFAPPVVIAGTDLDVGVPLDTGLLNLLLGTITNNTDATIDAGVLGGSLTLTVPPGASANLSVLGVGSLVLTATSP